MATEPEKYPSYFKTNQMSFFNVMERHHTSTVRWQHSWIGSCLSLDWPPQSPDDPPRLFPVVLCERWGLRSASACNPEQLEGSNTNSDCKNWSAFITKCFAYTELPYNV